MKANHNSVAVDCRQDGVGFNDSKILKMKANHNGKSSIDFLNEVGFNDSKVLKIRYIKKSAGQQTVQVENFKEQTPIADFCAKKTNLVENA